MSKPRLVDSVGGHETWFERDSLTGKVTIHERTNLTGHLAATDAERSMGGAIKPGLGRRVASIPFGIIGEWLQADGITWLEFNRWNAQQRRRYCANKVNDRDFYRFKTADRML